MEESKELRGRIRRAFATVRKPSVDELCNCASLESEGLKQKLLRFHWTEITSENVNDDIDFLFLSARGFHHYLPAFLMRGLDFIEDSSLESNYGDIEQSLFNHLMFRLFDEDEKDILSQQIIYLTQDQKEVVADFLTLALSDEEFEDHEEDVKNAIEKYWNSEV